jgi:nitrite reductase/ring-hydroxylating ferredoxin subunit
MALQKKYRWYKLAEPNEFLVAEGVIMHMAVPDKQFCITQHNGEYFAFQPKCPHAGASFEGGRISEDGHLICPLHRFAFDVKTGRNPSGEGFYLITYPIQQNEHGIWIGIAQQQW